MDESKGISDWHFQPRFVLFRLAAISQGVFWMPTILYVKYNKISCALYRNSAEYS